MNYFNILYIKKEKCLIYIFISCIHRHSHSFRLKINSHHDRVTDYSSESYSEFASYIVYYYRVYAILFIWSSSLNKFDRMKLKKRLVILKPLQQESCQSYGRSYTRVKFNERRFFFSFSFLDYKESGRYTLGTRG